MLDHAQPQPATAHRRDSPSAPPAPSRSAPLAARAADPALRCDPLAGVLARSVRERGARAAPALTDGPVIQRWWAGIRQLKGMSFLGVPWDWGGNPANLGLYHKHLFLEDGRDPADIGHLGPQGLGRDSHSRREYKKTQEGDDDDTMRRAIAKHDPAPPYKLTDSNCQQWVNLVITTYQGLGGKLGRQPAMEMSSI